jgi:leader peptidase (prepilin peptidase)/N-methyltransferase
MLFAILLIPAVVGASIGSLVLTAVDRSLRGEGWIAGRSQCDHCGVQLAYSETVPIASYLAIRGVCRHCGIRINPSHLAVEVAGGIVLVSAVLARTGWDLAITIALGLCLLGLAVIDIRTLRLPNLGVVIVAILGALEGGRGGIRDLALSAGVAVFSVVIVLALRRLYVWRTGQQGMGLGDVKLIGALALWLGIATPVATGLAALSAMIWAKVFSPSSTKIPFGAFLAAAAWVVGLSEVQSWMQ